MKRRAGIFAIALALAVGLMGAGCSQATGSADNAITVSASGKAMVATDKADISILVASHGATYEEAQANGTRIANDVIARLKTAGADGANIATEAGEAVPVYGGYEEVEVMGGYFDWDGNWIETGPETYYNDLTGVVVGYDQTTTVTVKAIDASALSTMLKEAVAAGATDFANLAFSVGDREAAYQAALTAAVDAAHAKAETLAGASKVYVGRVVNMVEQSDASSLVLTVPGDAEALDAADTSTLDIQPAQIPVEASVTVSYAIS